MENNLRNTAPPGENKIIYIKCGVISCQKLFGVENPNKTNKEMTVYSKCPHCAETVQLQLAPRRPDNVVGKRLAVWYQDCNDYFPCKVFDFDRPSSKFRVRFDTGDVEDIPLYESDHCNDASNTDRWLYEHEWDELKQKMGTYAEDPSTAPAQASALGGLAEASMQMSIRFNDDQPTGPRPSAQSQPGVGEKRKQDATEPKSEPAPKRLKVEEPAPSEAGTLAGAPTNPDPHTAPGGDSSQAPAPNNEVPAPKPVQQNSHENNSHETAPAQVNSTQQLAGPDFAVDANKSATPAPPAPGGDAFEGIDGL